MDKVGTWTKKVPAEFEALIDEGKQVELLVPNGLLVLQRDPEGALHITWLHQEEASFATRLQKTPQRRP